MKRKKGKVLIAALLASVLLSGTVIAHANSNSGTVGGYHVAGETYVNNSNYSAYCRTVSSSYNVYTEVDAVYSYYDPQTGASYALRGWNYGEYGCEVYLNLPSGNYIPLSVSAWHIGTCGDEEWSGGTGEAF